MEEKVPSKSAHLIMQLSLICTTKIIWNCMKNEGMQKRQKLKAIFKDYNYFLKFYHSRYTTNMYVEQGERQRIVISLEWKE